MGNFRINEKPKSNGEAQAEVPHVLEGQSNFEEANILKLNYLKLVVKESLRVHPPSALIPRESREKCEIYGCFHPEKFQDSSIHFKGSSFEFIPFGGGRRICPSISFAPASIELVLSQLLYHFNWKLANVIKPEFETFGLSCRRKNDSYLIATPLKHFLHERH
uniref:Cytochrome P450 n=1 Tax=Quercus lobata TaxID=97700 RepID=A0A7N2R2U5_QUELO